MKNFENKKAELKNLIRIAQNDLENGTYKGSEKNAIKKRNYYTELLRYLETDPKIEFVQSEKKRLADLIKAKESQFEDWLKDGSNVPVELLELPKKAKTFFNKEHGLSAKNKKLANLNFLLKNG